MNSNNPDVINQWMHRHMMSRRTPVQQFKGVFQGKILDTHVTNSKDPVGTCRVIIPSLDPNQAFGPTPYPGATPPPDGTACVVAFAAPSVNSQTPVTPSIISLEGFGGGGGTKVHKFKVLEVAPDYPIITLAYIVAPTTPLAVIGIGSGTDTTIIQVSYRGSVKVTPTHTTAWVPRTGVMGWGHTSPSGYSEYWFVDGVYKAAITAVDVGLSINTATGLGYVQVLQGATSGVAIFTERHTTEPYPGVLIQGYRWPEPTSGTNNQVLTLQTTDKIRWATPSGGSLLTASTPLAGVALVNGTQNILTLTVPNDGQIHALLCASAGKTVTSPLTGGTVGITCTAADGLPFSSDTSHTANGTYWNSIVGINNTTPILVSPGTTVQVKQLTAASAGAAVVRAKIVII